ncbi:MAG: response regulator [Treponema sp.]|jgi:signal transduction histidine kinase/CheY-like chemotaxis protein|nr:response regulator [Treponema sp.]
MRESGNASYFRAFLVVIITLIVFSVFFLLEAAAQGLMNLIITSVFLAFVFFLIIIMHNRDQTATEAFSVPFILFLANTFRCFITNDYSNYFSLCLGISCLGALFFNRRELVRFIFISTLIIGAQIVFRIPLKKPDQDGITAMTVSEMLFGWFIFLAGSVSVYLVTNFAEDKNNDAKKARDYFVGALSSTPDPMLLLDSLNRVTYISNSFMKMIHIERASHAKGRPVFDLLKEQNLKDLFYELLEKGDSCHTAREVILDGQQYFFEIVVSKFSSESRGCLINIVNITPVMKAKFEAEAASRSKSAFLATMSHEIRTPLNAIIGLSDIELQKELPAEARTNLEKIHNSGDSLLAIINDILDISKIETGNFEMVPVDYDMPSLVNDTVQLNIVRIGSKSLTFKLNMDETIPIRLFGDELRIKQILNNLLSNAFKYTEKGSVTLSISWEKRGDDAWVVFAIQDTGQGMKQQDIPKLFSEYRQLDAKANRHIEGTGLGLSITKNLVSLMEGKIGVESEYGKGSTFTVQILQRIVDETPIGEKIAHNLESFRFKDVYRSQSLRLARSYMPYGKVLVVDDVETNLDVAKGLMLPYGLSIDTALSGQEAIEKIQAAGKKDESFRYDVIFMDHMMPGMDGLEAVRIIRTELPGNYGRTVPIIALTANALTGNEKMFLVHGCNAFISKPIDIMQLDTALNTWVRDKQSAETLRKAEMELTRTKKDEPDISGILDNITVAGIDIVQGRDRYNGETAYLEILRSWCLHTPALLEKLRGLSPDNLPDYSVTVHGLKGSSYGIFANDIGKKAEELEGFAKAGDFSNVQAGNTAFIVMAESLLADLKELLEKAAAGKRAQHKISSPDPALLAKLLDATKRYKSTLMEEILADIESYDYESGGELVLWLREQMDNLEYDAICSRLETMAS